MSSLSQEQIDVFVASIRGDVFQPSSPTYDEARAIYNGMIDKKPRLIVQVADVADVMAAVKFGAANKISIAVRSGGHNGPGLSSVDGGMVVDLRNLKGIRVDPESQTVRCGPGHSQGDVDHASHEFGLHVPAGIVSSTGIAGLTVGGGHGYLSRQYGLTIDNLLEVDVVLADGSFVTANESKHSDLFWALRGGGGNFGIITSFLFQAHPVKMIYGGPIFFAQEDAATVMKWYRTYLPSLKDRKMLAFLGLKNVPSSPPFPEEIHGRKICAIITCYDGPAEEGEKHVKDITDALPAPIFQFTGPMPFTAIQTLFDPLLPAGLQWYWKGDYVKAEGLSDGAIEAHLKCHDAIPDGLSLMHLYPIDGAVHDVAPDATAWSTRDAQWSMVIAGIASEASRAQEITEWARDYWKAVHPYNCDGGYINFIGSDDDEPEGRLEATYGENYERLVAVKTKYDPKNIFHVNHNIKPSASKSSTADASSIAAGTFSKAEEISQ